MNLHAIKAQYTDTWTLFPQLALCVENETKRHIGRIFLSNGVFF